MKKFFPPGFPYKTELKLFAFFSLLAFLPQLFLIKKIHASRALLFVGSSYIEGRRMPDFIQLCKGSNAGFALLLLLSLSQGADFIFMDEPFATSDILRREDFYKVLLGLLEERESLILSTHLIEEVEGFVDRVLVLDRGRLVLDKRMEEIEDEESSLVKLIKSCLNYEANRVAQMIDEWN